MIQDSDSKYPYLETKTILDACAGNSEAQGLIIENYRGYVRKCIRSVAYGSYHISINKQNMEELEQQVIVEALETIWKFKPL